MPAKHASIGQVMMVIALAAVNFAVMSAVPWDIAVYPTIWVFLTPIDFVIFWTLIARRSLRAFHYTFLVVFVSACLFTIFHVATGRLRPLASLIDVSPTPSVLAECWAATFLSFLLAYAIGAAAAWLERTQGWDIAALWRGTFVGFGIFLILAMIADAAFDRMPSTSIEKIGRFVGLGFCLIVGGKLGLSRLKSSGPDRTARPERANVATDLRTLP